MIELSLIQFLMEEKSLDQDTPLLMTRQDLAKMGITYSNTHLLSLERIDAFPQRVRLSPQKVVWRHDEVIAWIDKRFSQRSGAA